jgi:hypothetical protein
MQYTVGKVFSRPFQRYIKGPTIPKILVGKPKKNQICSRLTTADQGGQKNRNEKTTKILFCNVFY